MADFVLSRHAMRRMAQRHISVAQIRRTLQHPNLRIPDTDDPELTHAIKRFHHRGGSVVLRVVYNARAKPWRIVTAFFERPK